MRDAFEKISSGALLLHMITGIIYEGRRAAWFGSKADSGCQRQICLPLIVTRHGLSGKFRRDGDGLNWTSERPLFWGRPDVGVRRSGSDRPQGSAHQAGTPETPVTWIRSIEERSGKLETV